MNSTEYLLPITVIYLKSINEKSRFKTNSNSQKYKQNMVPFSFPCTSHSLEFVFATIHNLINFWVKIKNILEKNYVYKRQK